MKKGSGDTDQDSDTFHAHVALPDHEKCTERLFDKVGELIRPNESLLRRTGVRRAVTGGICGSIRKKSLEIKRM
jgi:hypothetical protein